MNDMVVPRPIITVMSGDRNSGFIGVNVTFETHDQVDAMFERLEGHARGLAVQDGIDWDASNTFMLGIVMPCGARFLFRRAADIPRNTVPCNCEDPGHIVIQFTEKAKVTVQHRMWP